MRILVLSDIHANLTALNAVIDSAGTVDAVWCLGDIVGYGPDPNECVEQVRSLPNLVCLLGNHDAAALGQLALEAFNREARLSIQWLQNVLKPDNRLFLESLPEVTVIGETTLVHGSPRNPVWEYILEISTANENFYHFDTQLCFVGHTHLPVGYICSPINSRVERRGFPEGTRLELTGRAILNPGSVGQPRDHDPRAAYAIFDPDSNTWEACRAVYDIQTVQQRIYAFGLPFRHALRLEEGW